jgi:hypothetical protein
MADFDPDQLKTIKPGRSWRDYSANDIAAAAAQHGGTCLNARQALVLDVLCACEGTMSKITRDMYSGGDMPINELARLTNMSLLELVPEVVDLVGRSPINQFSFDVDGSDRGTEPEIVGGELRLVAQIDVAVRADNDPEHDDEEEDYQERGWWSPPSIDVPRVLTVGYWVDWQLLEDECENDDEGLRLDDLMAQFRQAARVRAGISRSPTTGE